VAAEDQQHEKANRHHWSTTLAEESACARFAR
jgi:hypothetical protein